MAIIAIIENRFAVSWDFTLIKLGNIRGCLVDKLPFWSSKWIKCLFSFKAKKIYLDAT